MGEIITFYSYKGGVGRTMALANVAVLLSKWGFKTLIVDWDLEAPGLEFYFKDYLSISEASQTEGIVDLLHVLKNIDNHNKTIEWREKIISIGIIDDAPFLQLITAGNKNNDYFSRVRKLDLDEFYLHQNGGVWIESLRNQWKKEYDFVLIDSRTGITDMGGICTVQLPDLVVSLFTANEQSFQGVVNTSEKIREAQQRLPIERLPTIVLPIPSRFDTTEEYKISQVWLNRFAEGLDDIYKDWLPLDVKKRDFLEITKIPYISYFSFGETLPVIEQGTKDRVGIGYAYETLAAVIVDNLQSADELVDNRDEFVKNISETSISSLRKKDYEMQLEGKKKYLAMPFTNREDEIASVLAAIAPPYHIFNAPAGYGKTMLLQRLREGFQERKWLTALINVSTREKKEDIIFELANGLVLDTEKLKRDATDQNFAELLFDKWRFSPNDEMKGGIAFLFDLEGMPIDNFEYIVNSLVPTTREVLSDTAFFSQNHNAFRVTFAGRYLARAKSVSRAKIEFRITKLAPFNLKVMKAMILQHERFRENNEATMNKVAADLFFTTGGHPGCVSEIVELYTEKEGAISTFVEINNNYIWSDIVKPLVDDVRAGIPLSLRGKLETLSVFRRFDIPLLVSMIKKYWASEAKHDDLLEDEVLELEKELLRTRLIDRNFSERILEDRITRRLLSIYLRHELSSDEFQERCKTAQEFCWQRLSDYSSQGPEKWLTEYLFQNLQQHAPFISEETYRRDQRDTFFNDALPSALKMFMDVRGKNKWRDDKLALLDWVDRDWEFCFMVNYYLRGSEFNERPCEKLREMIREFA